MATGWKLNIQSPSCEVDAVTIMSLHHYVIVTNKCLEMLQPSLLVCCCYCLSVSKVSEDEWLMLRAASVRGSPAQPAVTADVHGAGS